MRGNAPISWCPTRNSPRPDRRMYVLKHGIKKNPEKRWALPDRIFFGHGACAILAGVFLEHPPLEGFYGERILPGEGFSGNLCDQRRDRVRLPWLFRPRAVAGTPWKRLGIAQPRMALRNHQGRFRSARHGRTQPAKDTGSGPVPARPRSPGSPVPSAHRSRRSRGKSAANCDALKPQPMLRVACTSDPT